MNQSYRGSRWYRCSAPEVLSAAYGAQSVHLRERMARRLGLHPTDVPWHVARDGLAEYGWLCVILTATCARLARNIVDLSRTEIGEVFEPFNSHRGASSTMPQKVNPISSEFIIGLAGTAGASRRRWRASKRRVMNVLLVSGRSNGRSSPARHDRR